MLKELLKFNRPTNRLNPPKPDIPVMSPKQIISGYSEEEAEYRKLAQQVGVVSPHISSGYTIERFKDFLISKDWPIYDLQTVVKYMDEKAGAEGNGYGWNWRPLRSKDSINNAKFGKPSRRVSGFVSENDEWRKKELFASDYYKGPSETEEPLHSMFEVNKTALSPYDKLVPFHALKKVKMIEDEFKGDVKFFVCDYATAPHIIDPDPFLMAVIDNHKLHDGQGRFVIDFWDEPEFGLEKQFGV